MDRPCPSVDGHLGCFPFWMLEMLLCVAVNVSACMRIHFSWEYTWEWNCWCLFLFEEEFSPSSSSSAVSVDSGVQEVTMDPSLVDIVVLWAGRLWKNMTPLSSGGLSCGAQKDII